MTKAYIVRHAEADGNIYRRIHGQYDGWVTENGYAQLERLKERFKDEKFDAVYSSDLFRAVKTAECLTDGRRLSVIQNPLLREVNLGDWEDKTWGEIALNQPEMLYNFNNKPWLWHVPGAEDADTVTERMHRVFWEIIDENPSRTIAICTHGMALRFLLCKLLDKPIIRIDEISHCDNTGVSLIHAENKKADAIFLNDNSHLGDLSTLAKQKWWRKKSDAADGNSWYTPVDFDTQAELFKNIFFERPEYYMHLNELNGEKLFQKAKERAERDNRSVVFAYSGDKLIGTVIIDLDNISDDAGKILFLYLDEAYRKSGYGVQLIGYAVSIFRAMDLKYIELEVFYNGNNEAVSFFERYGFKKVSERPGIYGKVWLMRKIIDYYRQ